MGEAESKGLIATLSDPERHQRRRDELPSIYKTNHERLACELALGMDDQLDIFARHGYTAEQALALIETKEFSALLDRVVKEVRESGLSFRMKARAMAEGLLPHAYEMATDEYLSGTVRADLIQWIAKMGDLEPVRKDGKEAGARGGLTLNITFAGQAPQNVLNGREPITIEAGEE